MAMANQLTINYRSPHQQAQVPFNTSFVPRQLYGNFVLDPDLNLLSSGTGELLCGVSLAAEENRLRNLLANENDPNFPTIQNPGQKYMQSYCMMNNAITAPAYRNEFFFKFPVRWTQDDYLAGHCSRQDVGKQAQHPDAVYKGIFQCREYQLTAQRQNSYISPYQIWRDHYGGIGCHRIMGAMYQNIDCPLESLPGDITPYQAAVNVAAKCLELNTTGTAFKYDSFMVPVMWQVPVTNTWHGGVLFGDKLVPPHKTIPQLCLIYGEPHERKNGKTNSLPKNVIAFAQTLGVSYVYRVFCNQNRQPLCSHFTFAMMKKWMDNQRHSFMGEYQRIQINPAVVNPAIGQQVTLTVPDWFQQH